MYSLHCESLSSGIRDQIKSPAESVTKVSFACIFSKEL